MGTERQKQRHEDRKTETVRDIETDRDRDMETKPWRQRHGDKRHGDRECSIIFISLQFLNITSTISRSCFYGPRLVKETLTCDRYSNMLKRLLQETYSDMLQTLQQVKETYK